MRRNKPRIWHHDAVRPHRYERTAHLGLRYFLPDQVPAAAPILLCFPFVGGNSLVFKPLAEIVAPHWQVVAVDPPGHGAAPGAPLKDPEALARLVQQEVPEALLARATPLGYSLGSYTALSLVLQRSALPHRGLIVVAAVPYHLRTGRRYDRLSSDALFAELAHFGGVPADLPDARAFFDLAEPVIRADFACFHEAISPKTQFSGPILAISGRHDPLAPPVAMRGWAEYGAGLDFCEVEGHHVFLREQAPAMAQAIFAYGRKLSLS